MNKPEGLKIRPLMEDNDNLKSVIRFIYEGTHGKENYLTTLHKITHKNENSTNYSIRRSDNAKDMVHQSQST